MLLFLRVGVADNGGELKGTERGRANGITGSGRRRYIVVRCHKQHGKRMERGWKEDRKKMEIGWQEHIKMMET